MSGNLVQRWNMFCSDFGEYMRLCRRCYKLGRVAHGAFVKVATVCHHDSVLMQPVCIRVLLEPSGHNNLSQAHSPCNNYDNSSACVAEQCPMYDAKCAYQSACVARDAAIAARRAFWKKTRI